MAKKIDRDIALLRADRKAGEADDAALLALRDAMGSGRHVGWKHGRHDRLGEVVEVLGHQFHHARIRVRTHTGKTYVVPAGTVIHYLRVARER